MRQHAQDIGPGRDRCEEKDGDEKETDATACGENASLILTCNTPNSSAGPNTPRPVAAAGEAEERREAHGDAHSWQASSNMCDNNGSEASRLAPVA